ncbi:hypothetical protein HMPREF9123_0573 [Neisseria bacilliformis ATCC BAA-1200]|uniref:Uncharacterized protein n=1 Tax=Neisseria bacilliformis ATCC BAA-1200 TaxID=888742 RepID=F2B9X4_9NEIS|nr:hypothetical protein HMPREF9123_0573 [Neisseria bacilliformis ATCC BAA-1200]
MRRSHACGFRWSETFQSFSTIIIPAQAGILFDIKKFIYKQNIT